MGPVPSAHGALRRRPARDDVGGGRAALRHRHPGAASARPGARRHRPGPRTLHRLSLDVHARDSASSLRSTATTSDERTGEILDGAADLNAGWVPSKVIPVRDRRSRPIDARRFRTFHTQVGGGNGQNAPTRRRSFGFASRHTFDLQAMQVEYPLQLVDRELSSSQELEAGARCNAMHEPRSTPHSVQVEVNPFRRSHGRSTDRTHKGHGLPLARDLAGVLERPPDLEVAVSRSATKSCHVRRRNQDKPHLSQAENPNGRCACTQPQRCDKHPPCATSSISEREGQGHTMQPRRACSGEAGKRAQGDCSCGGPVRGSWPTNRSPPIRDCIDMACGYYRPRAPSTATNPLWPHNPTNTPRWNLRENRPSHRVGFRFRRPAASKIIRCLSALESYLWAERAASFSY